MFLKDIFEKVDFEKESTDDKKHIQGRGGGVGGWGWRGRKELILLVAFLLQGGQSRDTQLVISHFCACFRLD